MGYKISSFSVVVLAFAVLSLVSCNDTRRSLPGGDKVVANDSSVIDITHYEVHKIHIGADITNIPVASQLAEVGGREKYLLMDKNYIYVFDWEIGIKEDSVSTKDCGALQNYSGFTYVSPDTILVYNSGKNILFMLDAKGKVKGRWAVPATNDFMANPRPTVEGLNATRPECSGGKLLLSGPVLGNMSQVKDLRVPVSEFLDTKTEQWNNVAFYPEVYYEANWGSQYMNAVSVAKDGKGRFVYSYAVSDKVLRYGSDFSVCDTLLMRSRYDEGIEPCDLSPEDFDADPQKEIRYYISQPTYSSIMYDKHRDIYLRIAEHDFGGWEGKGTFAKPFSVIVADAGGNLLSESSIVRDRLLFNRKNMHIGKAGLFISMKNPDEDNLYFACFKIKKR